MMNHTLMTFLVVSHPLDVSEVDLFEVIIDYNSK